MSLGSPVISDLILATVEAERRAEVEQVRIRFRPERPSRRPKTAPTRGGVHGALKYIRALLPLQPRVVAMGRSALAPADPRPDGRTC